MPEREVEEKEMLCLKCCFVPVQRTVKFLMEPFFLQFPTLRRAYCFPQKETNRNASGTILHRLCIFCYIKARYKGLNLFRQLMSVQSASKFLLLSRESDVSDERLSHHLSIVTLYEVALISITFVTCEDLMVMNLHFSWTKTQCCTRRQKMLFSRR